MVDDLDLDDPESISKGAEHWEMMGELPPKMIMILMENKHCGDIKQMISDDIIK